MSELIITRNTYATVRRQLLTGGSVLTLAGWVAAVGVAKAEDAGRPLIWIELDGQFAQQENAQETFAPPFLLASPFNGVSQTDLQKAPPTIWDKDAKITFQPEGTGWVLSAGIRYGKGSRSEALNQLTAHPTGIGANYDAFQNVAAKNSESHIVLDFQAGKDVGLGGFGNSVLNLGVRFAQFNSQRDVDIHSQPTNANSSYNRLYGSLAAKRKSTGVGPSLSWDVSANLVGDPSGGSISFDGGVNGALLFGRQRVQAHHQTTDRGPGTASYQTSKSPNRSKNVLIPNLGGFAGVSWRYPNAKVSVGYRADFFFGALDGGIDARKNENVGFYGPFATVSVGLGG